MSPDGPIHEERELARIHLLITRGDIAEARVLLARLARAGVPQQDIQPLLDAIGRREEQAKGAAERKRDLRYYLGLQTTAARIGYFLLALAAATHGLWSSSVAIGRGMARGFATVITTIEHTKAGTHPWTRPIYVDLIYAALWLILGVVAMAVVVWASRGAEQWEETDTRYSSRYTR